MSGPKVTIYRVEPYVRENILKQIRLKRRCISLAQQIGDKISDLSVLEEQCEELIRERSKVGGYIRDSAKADSELRELLREIREKKAILSAELQNAGPIEPIPSKLHYSPEIVEQDEKKVQALQTLLGKSKTSVAECREKTVKLMSRHQIDYQSIQEKATADVSAQGGFDFDSIAVRTAKHDWSRRDQAMKKLKAMITDPVLSDELKDRARIAVKSLCTMENEHLAGNYISVTVTGILRDADRERARRAEEMDEFNARIKEYHALCEALQKNPMPIPFDGDWRSKIQEAMIELEACSAQESQKAYVADALDSVMEEMGYHVIGYRKVRKKSGKTFHSTLYSFADGRAVIVTRSDDGQITMEVCGMDHGDRLPESHEAKALEEDMYTFCTSFHEIERRLKARGVLMESRISMAPPSEEYATIINLDDFVLMTEQVETISAQEDSGTTQNQEMHES